jgi:hypothetical protein
MLQGEQGPRIRHAPPSPAPQLDSAPAEAAPALPLRVGARVELVGLASRPELNGCVATVAAPLAGGRHKVALDQGGKPVNARPANLRTRPVPASTGPAGERGAMVDGHLREDEGRLFHAVLDMLRIYSNERAPRSKELFGDGAGEALYRLRQSPQGKEQLRHLTATAWTYWLPHPGHDFPGVRGRLLEWVEALIKELNEQEAEPAACFHSAAGYRRVQEQLQSGDAAYWGEASRRISGTFVALEQRPEGTLLLREATPAMTNVAGANVPACDDELYLVSGIADGFAEMFARAGYSLPIGPLRLTLLPWRGRWVYDGLAFGRMQPLHAHAQLVARLRASAARLEAAGKLSHTPPPPTPPQVASLARAERRARFAVAAVRVCPQRSHDAQRGSGGAFLSVGAVLTEMDSAKPAPDTCL